MSRKEKARASASRHAALLGTGDHLSAARQARSALSDPRASPEQRVEARSVLASLAPEPAAALLGSVGVLVATGIALWVILGGRQ